jgi:hypothetical protein
MADEPGPSSTSGPVELPADFSWKKLFADKLQDQSSKGSEVFVDTDEALKGKHVALYFSAHW